MVIFLAVFQLGPSRGSAPVDSSSISLLTSNAQPARSPELPTMVVPVPHEEVQPSRQVYEKPYVRVDATGIVKNREINPHAMGNDIARMIASRLGKAANQEAERSFAAHTAPSGERINEAERSSQETTRTDQGNLVQDANDVGDDVNEAQKEQGVQSSKAFEPIDLGTPPENLPKFEGDLPDDWNVILQLRAAFMDKHYPSPKPGPVTSGKLANLHLRVPSQIQTFGQVGANGQLIILLRSDSLYQKGTWDKSPIIIEKYKLVFFTVPKVGCTAFKQLFRRMMGYPNWRDHQYYNEPFLPHNPAKNGLKYLSDYPFDVANDMLTNPLWTRAVFVRRPEERVLSAYLDKAAYSKGYYLRMRCCDKVTKGGLEWNLLQCGSGTKQYTPPAPGETNTPIMSFEKFLNNIIPKCSDPHWEPQAIRMAPKYWERINFVGRFENIYEDTKRLLTQLGAWDKYGASGWDEKGQEGAIFDPNQKAKHGTAASDKASKSEYLTPEAVAAISSYYDMDYTHTKLQLEPPYA